MQTQMQPNPSGTSVAVGVGVVLVAGVALYLAFKPKPAAAAEAASPNLGPTRQTPGTATCPLDPAKLASWGIQHGYQVIAIPSGPPPPMPPSAGLITSNVVAVTSDGNFWTYTVPPFGAVVITKRDDIRDAYCKSFGATAGSLAAMFMV